METNEFYSSPQNINSMYSLRWHLAEYHSHINTQRQFFKYLCVQKLLFSDSTWDGCHGHNSVPFNSLQPPLTYLRGERGPKQLPQMEKQMTADMTQAEMDYLILTD